MRVHERGLIEAAGAQLRFLATYLPDLDPIEHAFSKLEHQRRKAAANARVFFQAAENTFWGPF